MLFIAIIYFSTFFKYSNNWRINHWIISFNLNPFQIRWTTSMDIYIYCWIDIIKSCYRRIVTPHHVQKCSKAHVMVISALHIHDSFSFPVHYTARSAPNRPITNWTPLLGHSNNMNVMKLSLEKSSDTVCRDVKWDAKLKHEMVYEINRVNVWYGIDLKCVTCENWTN